MWCRVSHETPRGRKVEKKIYQERVTATRPDVSKSPTVWFQNVSVTIDTVAGQKRTVETEKYQ